jgi:hypothetical protein
LSGTYVSSSLTDTATRAIWDVSAGLQNVEMTQDEASMTYADATFTYATGYLTGNECFNGITYDQAGFTYGGTVAEVMTFAGWPDVVAALTPTVEQRFASGSYAPYVPAEVSAFTQNNVRITLRRPHTRYVPQILALVGRSYDFPGVYYGAFYDQTDQAAAAANTAYALEFGLTSESNGVSIVNDGSGNPTRITFTYAGTYNVQFSAQFTHSGGSDADIDLWLAKNGTNVDDSNSKFTIKGGHESVQSWNFVVTVAASDYLQLKWSSTDTGVSVEAYGAGTSPTRPAVPSTILTVTPVQSAGVGSAGGGGGGGAPTDATYVTLSTNSTLTNERVLTAGSGITITDAGAGLGVTIAATGFAPTTLPYLTVGNTTDLSNERAIAVADDIIGTDGGANSTYTISGSGLLSKAPANALRNTVRGTGSGYPALTLRANNSSDAVLEIQDATNLAKVVVSGNGNVTIKGTLTMDANSIASVADPTNNQDAATKAYSDTKVAKSTATTKGDLFVATAASTVTRLGVGANDYVLTADSTTAEGVAWKVTPTGPQGAQGPQGVAGPQGPEGAKGAQGAQGAQGSQGPQGANGADGAQGAIGPQGPEGAKGAQGAQGAQGSQGPQGANGADGAQGAIGPQGPEGAKGAQGAQGAQGSQGPQGANGADGAQGAIGPQGPEGAKGAQGAQGAQGSQGPQGATGAQGAEGGTTTLTAKGDLLTRTTSTVVRLPIGTNDYVLTADSSTAEGIAWKPATGSGTANLADILKAVNIGL